jgi:uncharacterized HAD superfamily protein
MRIGIDIDETIAATFEPVFNFAKDRYGFDAVFDDLVHHDWSNVKKLGISQEEEVMIFREFYAHTKHEGVNPVPGSVAGCQSLLRSGHELFAITGRSGHTREPTEHWLSQHFPNVFSGLVFTGHLSGERRPKSEVCQELKISEMVEDNIDFALDLVHSGIRTHLLDRPWNRTRTDTHPLLVRISGWHELDI